MTTLARPLSAGALDEYVRDLFETVIAGDPADAAAVAAGITAFDESAAVQNERYRQVIDGALRVGGRAQLSIGQVTGLAITNAGSGYEVNDKITVSTSTGAGASGRVATVDGGGAILTVELTIAGADYAVADTATVISTTAGTAGVITATVAKNFKQFIIDALAVLIP